MMPSLASSRNPVGSLARVARVALQLVRLASAFGPAWISSSRRDSCRLPYTAGRSAGLVSSTRSGSATTCDKRACLDPVALFSVSRHLKT